MPPAVDFFACPVCCFCLVGWAGFQASGLTHECLTGVEDLYVQAEAFPLVLIADEESAGRADEVVSQIHLVAQGSVREQYAAGRED